MKKILIYITVVAGLAACNDPETEGISRVTYFPEFVMEGSDLLVVDDPATYTEPGIEVLEQGAPIDFTTTYEGRYTGYSSTTTVGTEDDEYTVTYGATNRDGFSATATRSVIVTPTGDFQTSIAGAYLAQTVRSTDEGYDELIIMISEVSPGVFEITDALGGFYTDGRALGDDYLVVGLQITVNDLATNDFSYNGDVERLDGIAMEVSDLEIDPETKTISFHTSAPTLTSGDWDIVLTQIQPE